MKVVSHVDVIAKCPNCRTDFTPSHLLDWIETLHKNIEQLHTRNEDLVEEIQKLTAVLMRIDGINDNPACFNPEIDAVLRTVGMSR